MPMLQRAAFGRLGIDGESSGFSRKDRIRVVRVDPHDAEALRLLERGLQTADRDVGDGALEAAEAGAAIVHLTPAIQRMADPTRFRRRSTRSSR